MAMIKTIKDVSAALKHTIMIGFPGKTTAIMALSQASQTHRAIQNCA
jgi:hypothetical protein